MEQMREKRKSRRSMSFASLRKGIKIFRLTVVGWLKSERILFHQYESGFKVSYNSDGLASILFNKCHVCSTCKGTTE